jgi:hypothetical protein
MEISVYNVAMQLRSLRSLPKTELAPLIAPFVFYSEISPKSRIVCLSCSGTGPRRSWGRGGT